MIIHKSIITSLVLLISNGISSEYHCSDLIKKSPEYHLLDLAYKYKSSALREAVFNLWSKESRIRELNINIGSKYNATAYELYKNVYKPKFDSYNEFVIHNYNVKDDYLMQLLLGNQNFDIDDRMELFEFAKQHEAFYNDAKYLVLQDSIPYIVRNDASFSSKKIISIEEKETTDSQKSIQNIYKYVTDPHKIILYLDEFHNCLLDAYIESSTDSLISENEKYSNQIARRDFISQEIQISRFHWGNGWYYHSFPLVVSIILNESNNRAIIEKRDSWSGGSRVNIDKRDNQWILDSNRNNSWME